MIAGGTAESIYIEKRKVDKKLGICKEIILVKETLSSRCEYER